MWTFVQPQQVKFFASFIWKFSDLDFVWIKISPKNDLFFPSFKDVVNFHQRHFWEETPNFWEFYVLLPLIFYCFLLTNLRKLSKFGVLCSVIFFSKNSPESPNIFWNFFNFSKSRKTIFCAQNHHIEQNFAKFSHKTPKIVNFSWKIVIFQNFLRLWRRKFGVLWPQNTIFWSWPPLDWGLP